MNATRTGAFAGALLGIGLLTGCGERGPAQKPPTAVKVWLVEANTTEAGTRYSATIRPKSQVDLAFKVGGYVTQILQVPGQDGRLREVQEGDRVHKGAVLARLGESDYQVKRNQVNATLAEGEAAKDQARSFLAEAEASFEQAQADYGRAKNLLQMQSLPRSDFDAAKARYEVAQASVEKVRAQLKMAEARVSALKEQLAGADIALQDTTLVAPMGGTIVKRHVEQGSLAAPGAVLFELADTSSVKVVFGVPDVVIGSLTLGSQFSVASEAIRGRRFRGAISRLSPSADPASHVFEVELLIPNPKNNLKPGMIVGLEVAEPSRAHGTPAIPLSAIVRSKTVPTGYAVYVVDGTGEQARVQLRDVTLGNPRGNRFTVLSGVNAGERVVVAGATLVADGDPVRIVP
ncbi:MAG: efflux RND transporter periplasmic adaptor subunit [Nitrospiraceae bacterium]